jgi:hypothetical protein
MKPVKRGRPKKNYSHLIGQEFNQLRIIGILLSDPSGHPMCRTQCLVPGCKRRTPKRTSDVIAGRAKTCGCNSKRAFIANNEKQVDLLTASEIEAIWCAVQEAPSIKSAAEAAQQPPFVVSFGARRHQRLLDGFSTEKTEQIWKAAQRASLEEVGTQFGLTRRSVAYIVRKVYKPLLHPDVDSATLSMVLDHIKSDIQTRRSEPGVERFWPLEFAPEELKRKRNGVILGAYADMYMRFLKYPNLHHVELGLANLIRWFLETAEKTFNARASRRKSFLKQQRQARAQPPIDRAA